MTELQLQEAIQHQVLYGGRLGTNLYELGHITEARLQEALSRALGVQALVIDPAEVDPEAVKLVSKELASRLKVFPYRVRGKTLTLLMVDPRDHGAVAQIGYTLGFIVRTAVVPEFRMVQLLHDHYGVDERWRYTDTHRPAGANAPPLDPAAAAARIDSADSRDEVVQGTLGLLHRFFRRVIFLIVRDPWVIGWSAIGEGVHRALPDKIRVPLGEPSVFQTVTRDKTMFLGRFGPEPENQRFLEMLGKRPQTNAAVFPIVVRGRVVNLVYADAGPAGNVKADMGELLVLLQKVPKAYLRIIRRRIAETRKATGPSGPSEENE